MDVVGQRIAAFLGKNGRATLKRLVENEFGLRAATPAGDAATERSPGWDREEDRLGDRPGHVIPGLQGLLSDRLGSSASSGKGWRAAFANSRRCRCA